MGTLERGLPSLWVGICVVLELKVSPDYFDMLLSLDVVCALFYNGVML